MQPPVFQSNQHVEIDFSFPLKGVCDTHERTDQPEQTTVDMLNVLPFDRSLRLRGATRAGITRLFAVPTS